jgi:diphthamide synthase (EF-2-diphthine--ammonia ligase)
MLDPVVLYWSGGKDCSLALHTLRCSSSYRVDCLLTTLTEGYDRVTGHGVRRSLIERQATALGIALYKSYIPKQASMSQYEAVTEAALAELRKQGIRVAASGDIFQDQHRIAIFQKAGLKEYFPLWPGTTQDQIRAFLQSGLKAYVSCVDSGRLDACFVGRTLDAGFLSSCHPI